jgi:hypothetical protein
MVGIHIHAWVRESSLMVKVEPHEHVGPWWDFSQGRWSLPSLVVQRRLSLHHRSRFMYSLHCHPCLQPWSSTQILWLWLHTKNKLVTQHKQTYLQARDIYDSSAIESLGTSALAPLQNRHTTITQIWIFWSFSTIVLSFLQQGNTYLCNLLPSPRFCPSRAPLAPLAPCSLSPTL